MVKIPGGNNPLNRVTEVYGAQKNKPADKAAAVTGPVQQDRVELSVDAKRFQALLDKLKATPEERSELVQRLRKEISDGTYQVSARDLAQRLLNLAADDPSDPS